MTGILVTFLMSPQEDTKFVLTNVMPRLRDQGWVTGPMVTFAKSPMYWRHSKRGTVTKQHLHWNCVSEWKHWFHLTMTTKWSGVDMRKNVGNWYTTFISIHFNKNGINDRVYSSSEVGYLNDAGNKFVTCYTGNGICLCKMLVSTLEMYSRCYR